MAVKKKDEERVSQDIAGRSSTSGASSGGYRPLDSSGNDYASMAGMSDIDKAALDAAGKSWSAANKAGDKVGMDAAHAQAEAIRGQYGYSGGSDGSQYLPNGNMPFNYEPAPSYTSKYQSQIDDLTAAILGRGPFEYNYLDDPNYQQYAESYTRSGQRAMQDTLGQVSARTGGLASSYATAASQQTYDNYMAALADKIPELRQLAYSMYVDEGNQMRTNLDMLMALEQGDYGKYQDLITQYNADRNFNYGIYRDDISDSRYDQEWNYQVGRDQLSDQRYEDETAWERSQYESETEYNRALEKAQTLASFGDFSGYAALGYTADEIAAMQSRYAAEQAAARNSYSGRGSSGSSSSSNYGGGMDYEALFESAMASGYPKSYIANNYKNFGFTSSTGLYDEYQSWESSNGNGGQKGTNGDYSLSDLNTDSVLSLGIGPISYQMVEQLVEDGKVDAYTDSNGVLSVRWANGWNADKYKGQSAENALNQGEYSWLFRP